MAEAWLQMAEGERLLVGAFFGNGCLCLINIKIVTFIFQTARSLRLSTCWTIHILHNGRLYLPVVVPRLNLEEALAPLPPASYSLSFAGGTSPLLFKPASISRSSLKSSSGKGYVLLLNKPALTAGCFSKNENACLN